jgi:hypothetical protein
MVFKQDAREEKGERGVKRERERGVVRRGREERGMRGEGEGVERDDC